MQMISLAWTLPPIHCRCMKKEWRTLFLREQLCFVVFIIFKLEWIQFLSRSIELKWQTVIMTNGYSELKHANINWVKVSKKAIKYKYRVLCRFMYCTITCQDNPLSFRSFAIIYFTVVCDVKMCTVLSTYLLAVVIINYTYLYRATETTDICKWVFDNMCWGRVYNLLEMFEETFI